MLTSCFVTDSGVCLFSITMAGITPSRTFSPGDLIYSEEVFARVLPRDKKDEKCEFCHKSSENLIECSDCMEVKYCGIECTAKDSGDHRTECANMSKLREDAQEDFVRLLGRIIHKIKDRDWRSITKNVMGNYFSFHDIDSHYDEMTENPRYILLYKGIKDALKEFIGEENMPTDENLIQIIGKVKFSQGVFTTSLPTDFFLGMGKFDHECIPSSNLETIDNVMKLWAIKKIGPFDKVTVTHRKILTTDYIRTPNNEDTVNVCRCTECSLPYGESVLTKIIDERKAYDVIRITEKVINISRVLSNLDLEKDFRLRILVDKALEKQIAVLGPTHALHLKLLAIKAMTLEGTDIQKKMYLIELEKNMCSAFGEYYAELYGIYQSLVVLNFKLGNLLESALYLQKSKKVAIQETKEDE